VGRIELPEVTLSECEEKVPRKTPSVAEGVLSR